jgi:hypothetical protein
MEFELTKEERLQYRLAAMIQIIGVLSFDLKCIQQDNSSPNSGVCDLLYSGILNDIAGEITAIDGLLTYVLENFKPVTGYSPEEIN